MDIKRNYEYLLSDLKSIKGVGLKTSNLLKRKKINSIFDLLWKLPKSYTDRSLSSKIKDLKIDEIQTITIIPLKYSFPRVRNLPNRVLCKDDTGEIDCVFFNSYEGYIKKQQREIEKTRKQNAKEIPVDLNFEEIAGLSNEVVERLKKSKPETIGSAKQIEGVTPAAIDLVLIQIKKKELKKQNA